MSLLPMDRRTALASLTLAAACSCVMAKGPRRAVENPLDPARWRAYKARFLLPEGRIIDTGNGGISHSEGQGYGLLLAQAAGDKESFHRILTWTEGALARDDIALFSWRYVPGAPNPVSDRNNASDADLLIAWALLRAGQAWGESPYLDRSAAIRTAVAEQLVVGHGGRTVLLPALEGFRHEGRVTINPSYYVWPALDAFAALGGGPWVALRRDGLEMLGRMRFGAKALPADWVDVRGDGRLEPAAGHPPRFGYEAVRIPLYLMLSGRRSGSEAVRRFWQSGPIAAPPAWIDLQSGETAPYALSPGGQAIAARLNEKPLPGGGVADGDYFSATLGMLATLIG